MDPDATGRQVVVDWLQKVPILEIVEPRKPVANFLFRPRAAGALSLVLMFVALGSGCRVLQTAANVPLQAVQAVTSGSAGQRTADPVVVQQNLLRFADEYAMRMIASVDTLRRGTNALSAAEALQMKIALGTETWSIAASPNAIVNLFDMTIFVTITRMGLEDYWQPAVFGESAAVMLANSRNAETEIWKIAGAVLTLKHQTELRRSVEVWYGQNPSSNRLVASRALGLSSQVVAVSKNDAATPGSVFSLLGIDPFAGMDPAVRELAATRMFAERALFISQKMPMLLRWQTELLSVNTVKIPEVQQLVANSTQLADSMDRFARVAEQLPRQLSFEREALVLALQAQENDIAKLMSSGTVFSASLNTTLTTFDALMCRFGVGETNRTERTTTNTEPFRIQNYTESAAQFEVTARQLTELLVTLDRTLGSTNLLQFSARIGPVVQQAQTAGREMVNNAFQKGLLLVVSVLASALLYRMLVARLRQSGKTGRPAP